MHTVECGRRQGRRVVAPQRVLQRLWNCVPLVRTEHMNQDGSTGGERKGLINEAWGANPAANGLNGYGMVDVEIVTDAALGLGCSDS
jgi:hypothetical protein